MLRFAKVLSLCLMIAIGCFVFVKSIYRLSKPSMLHKSYSELEHLNLGKLYNRPETDVLSLFGQPHERERVDENTEAWYYRNAPKRTPNQPAELTFYIKSGMVETILYEFH